RAARARRRGPALHRAAARARRARGARAAVPGTPHAGVPRRDAARRRRRAPDRGARRTQGVEHQGAPDRGARRGVPDLSRGRRLRRRAVGRNDAGIRDRFAGGARDRGTARVRLSVGSGAQLALVREGAAGGRGQADHGEGRPHGRSRRVGRPAAGRGALPFSDPGFTIERPMIPTEHQPTGYWATNLYPSPRKRPRSDAPLKDLPPRAAQRFKRAREGIRALRHVTEQVVFMGTAWKWVWMYEVGGRKLAYLHPMETALSGTFILSES